MASEHDDLVLLIGPDDLTDDVVTRNAVRHKAIANVELKFNGSIVGKQPGYSAIVFISHYNRWNNLGDVECPVIKGTDKTMVHRGIIDPYGNIVINQELIELLV